jgi:hypothetical protein
MTDTEHTRVKGIFVVLGILQLITGIGAVPAGISLIVDPSGRGLTWTLEMLGTAPFSDYLIPGILLLLVNGLGSLTGAVLSFRRHPFSGPVAAGLGVFLIGWIVAQVWWMGLSFWLQPLFFFVGIVELGLGWLIWKKSGTAG